MSRYMSEVPAQQAAEVFGVECSGDTVIVAHGYDDPCYCYFCDLAATLDDEEPVGIYYGLIGLSKELDRWAYYAAMQKLGLTQAADAVGMDIPY